MCVACANGATIDPADSLADRYRPSRRAGRPDHPGHSNETVWPWYSHIAPISWLVAHDVHEGRDELNFSVWETYDVAKRRKKLTETLKEVAEGEMPPWYYVLMHSTARLDTGDQDHLRAWATEEAARAER